jgi:MFS family permease
MSRDISQIIGTMLPTERRAVRVIALIAVCRMFGLFALLPVLAVFAADLEGATPALVGIAVGGYGLTQAALQIPFGALSDRIGRIPVLLFGLGLFAAGSILAANSETINGVIAGRFLQGAGAISATLTALLADATREEVRTRSMAIFGISIGGSFVLALVAGPAIAAAFGVRSLFWMAAALAILAGALLALLPGGIHRPVERPERQFGKAIRPDLLRLDLFIFLLHAILTASFVALPFLLRNEIGIPVETHWQYYIGAMAASLVLTIPLVLADEHKGKATTVATAILLVLAGQLVLALLAPASLTVFLALALFFGGFNFLEAGLPSRLSVVASGEVRGAALGVFSSAQFLGAFAGGLIGGYFMQGGNPATVFMACAVIGAAWLIAERWSAGRQ